MKVYYWDDFDEEDCSLNDIAEEDDFYVGSEGGWYRRVRGGFLNTLYWSRLDPVERREAQKNFEREAEAVVRRSLGLS